MPSVASMNIVIYAILIFFGVFVAVHFVWIIYSGIVAKKLARHTKKFFVNKKNSKVRILIVGDSVSYGTGAKDPKNSIVGRLSADIPKAHIENLSGNGLHISELIIRLNTAKEKTYSLVILQTGGMDTIHFTRMKKWRDELSHLFNQAKKISSGKVVFVSVNNVGSAPIFYFPMNFLYTYRARKIREESRRIAAKKDIIFVDLFREKKEDTLLRVENSFAADNIHPNDKGYGVWYNRIRNSVVI